MTGQVRADLPHNQQLSSVCTSKAFRVLKRCTTVVVLSCLCINILLAVWYKTVKTSKLFIYKALE